MVKALLANIINAWMILMTEKNKAVVEADMAPKTGSVSE